MGDDHIDTVVSHIIRPYPISIDDSIDMVDDNLGMAYIFTLLATLVAGAKDQPRLPAGRGSHSSTLQLNVSTF